MNLLRVFAPIDQPAQQCQWVLLDVGHAPVSGEGSIADLPHRGRRVQLVIPASQVLIVRARLPHKARRRPGSVLAFAVEDQIAGDPDSTHVSWLGAAKSALDGVESDSDVLAVVDKRGLQRWREALEAVGVRSFEIFCETLLLPLETNTWSLAWDGREGFARTGPLEGAATDRGDDSNPPLSLSLALEAAEIRGDRPSTISIFPIGPDAAPDVPTWQRKLGVELRMSGNWDWRTAPADGAVSLATADRHWHRMDGMLPRLRPAAWLAAAALAIHGAMLVADWAVLAAEQRGLREQMEARFRSVFPEAVAVVDPALQMRRKLTDARHAAGQLDGGDFLPMLEKVAVGMNGIPPGNLRIVSYEGGRMTLEFASLDEALAGRLVARLAQAGLSVEPGFRPQTLGGGASGSTQSRTSVITVRAP